MRRVSGPLVAIALIASSSWPATTAAAAGVEQATCDGLTATIVGTPGDDTLTGTPGDDVIAGLAGDDVVDGGGGFDHLCGGRGSDMLTVPSSLGPNSMDAVLVGGRGDDRLEAFAHWPHFDGGPGDDVEISHSKRPYFQGGEPGHDVVGTHGVAGVHLDFRPATSGVRLDLRAGTARARGSRITFKTSAETYWMVRGSRYADVLSGSDGWDTLGGARGDDLVEGRGGHDVLQGGRGDDTLRGGSSDDILRLDGHDAAFGGAGPDAFSGLLIAGRRVALDGGSGSNNLALGVAVARPGFNHQHVLVDLARGILDVDGARTRFHGTFHSFFAELGARAWRINGTRGDDVLTADVSAHVVVDGRGGDDVIATGRGNDFLDGGRGHDLADAAEGDNVCLSIEGPRPPASKTHCHAP